MANDAHLLVLKRGVALWNEWRGENTAIVPDLGGARLPDANLGSINFAGANLGGANLSHARLARVDLGHANLIGTTLIGADLSGANLTRADLHNADLMGANLSGANMAGANLSSMRLQDADLSEANLGGARLYGTNLSGARLIGTNLCDTYFGGVSLHGTDFGRAIASRAFFVDLDLSDADGLEDVEHHSRSEISLSTIYTSGGKIPKIFLRGCGVPDDFIVYMPSLTAVAISFYSCFISYSHVDVLFARRLHAALQRHGIRCWLDEHQLLPGHDIFEEVDRGIQISDKVLLCCSKDSLSSWWVDDEITKAYEKEQNLMRQRGEKVLALIPLNLDGYLFSGEWKSGKASQIKSRLAADFTGWETDGRKFEQQFQRLVEALRTPRRGH